MVGGSIDVNAYICNTTFSNIEDLTPDVLKSTIIQPFSTIMIVLRAETSTKSPKSVKDTQLAMVNADYTLTLYSKAA